MKKEKVVSGGVMQFAALIFLILIIIMFLLGLSIYVDQERENKREREAIERYDVIIQNALKEHNFEYESIDYSKLGLNNIVLINYGNLNLEYEKVYEVMQAIDIVPDVILVSSSGDTYKTDGVELLKNDETVWENEKEIYRKYFQEGLCSYPGCDGEPYEDKYYCVKHCCHEEGCNLFSDPVVSFCDIHSCIYPGCGNPRSLRYHGDGDFCRVHKNRSWEKYITDERRDDFG